MPIDAPSSDETALVLHAAPEPETVNMTDQQAVEQLPQVDQGRQLEIGSQAKSFTTELAKVNPSSPEFQDRIRDIETLGQKELLATTAGPSRMLERSSSSLAGAKRNGGDAATQVAGTLTKLRGTIEDLTPNAADLTGVRKILGFIPGGNKIRHYFQRYENAQTQLDAIIKSLLAGQDELRKDNASLAQERTKLWDAMGQLNEYAVFAQKLDDSVVAEVETLKNAGNVTAANALETDVLFAVRQRRQDIITQLGVSVQGYMAMALVQNNNKELIKGVERARTTTLTALQTAVIVAQALDTQKLVLDQIDAINTTTNNMILNTSKMLRQQTGRVHEQAVNSGVSVETLTKAFDDVFATIDAIDTFKRDANVTMDKTIGALSTQLERAKPSIDRVRALETAGDSSSAPKQIGA